MKLLKGLFAIALISMIAVSCTSEKKKADATTDEVEVVQDAEKMDMHDHSKMADHKCDENCTKENCPMMKKMAEHKCDENCKKDGCKMKMMKDHKCDENCKKDGCKMMKMKDHKCDENCKKEGCKMMKEMDSEKEVTKE